MLSLRDAEAKTGIAAANLRRAILSGRLRAAKTISPGGRPAWQVEETDLRAYDAGITRGRARADSRIRRLATWVSESDYAHCEVLAGRLTISEWLRQLVRAELDG